MSNETKQLPRHHVCACGHAINAHWADQAPGPCQHCLCLYPSECPAPAAPQAEAASEVTPEMMSDGYGFQPQAEAAERNRLRAALAFYADEGNYQDQRGLEDVGEPEVFKDEGRRARAALDGKSQTTEEAWHDGYAQGRIEAEEERAQEMAQPQAEASAADLARAEEAATDVLLAFDGEQDFWSREEAVIGIIAAIIAAERMAERERCEAEHKQADRRTEALIIAATDLYATAIPFGELPDDVEHALDRLCAIVENQADVIDDTIAAAIRQGGKP